VTRLTGTADLTEAPAEHRGRGRIVWTFADQALSSLTNAALAIVVARTVTDGDFGAFALAVLTYGFIVGLVRTFVGEPFVVRFTAVGDAERRRGTAHATGAALSFGLLAAVGCLAAAALVGGLTAATLTALALSLPGLMLQDTWRHLFFAAGRPAAATINDLVWTVLQFGLLGVLLAGGSDSLFLITLAWGVSASVAAAVGYLQTGIAPSPRATVSWVRETRDISVRLGLGYAINMGAINLVTYVIGGIVGLAAVGALRAAQTVLGPLNLLFAGFNSFILPMLSRAAAAGERLRRTAILGSAALAVVSSAWIALLVLMPPSLGQAILGDSWEGAHRVMLPSGLLLLAVGLVLGASNSLVALSRSDLMLRVTTVQAPAMLLLGGLGAWRGGVVAAAYGVAIAQAIGVSFCWFLFLRADADPARRPAAG
jgi:O-antigen/teichoic acid export membrane protein